MNNDKRKRLLGLLQALYGEQNAIDILADLEADLPVPRTHQTRNDCMLISYANTLVSADAAPLPTLGAFLQRYLPQQVGRLHLLPFFPSSSDDGFAVIDYRMVDHHVGSWDDVESLAQDYDLMFDLVINHCSRENLWFVDFINQREPGRNFFITLNEESDTSMVARPRSTPLISTVHTYAGLRHVWTTFSEDQVDLDFSNPAVLREMLAVLYFYIERGARLIRLDAVGYLWKRLGTSCLNLEETHAVVKIIRALVDEVCPQVRIITETNVPHDENIAYFGAGDEAHLVYQFSLAPLLVYSYLFGNGSYLTRWAQQLQAPPPNTTYLNFIASHDGIGLRPVEGLMPEVEVDRLVAKIHERGGFVTLREVAPDVQKPYEMNISLLSAFGGEEGIPAFVGAHALLLSLQGSPALYIHSLLGTLNDLDLVEQTGRTRSINRTQWSVEDLQQRLADPQSINARVLAALSALIRCRNAQPALQPDAAQRVCAVGEGVFALYRECPAQRLCIVGSLLDTGQEVSLAQLELPGGVYTDVLSGSTLQLAQHISLGPYQTLWLQPGAN